MRRLVILVLALSTAGCPACFVLDFTETAYPFPCDPDAGEPAEPEKRQCVPGWRCGLERRCHVRDAGAWLCSDDDDSWCEADWECGPLGFCVPPIDDAFREVNTREVTFSGIEHIAPKGLDRFPDFVAVAPEDGILPGVRASGIAYIIDAGAPGGGQFILQARTRLGPPDDPILGFYRPEYYAGTAPPGVRALGASISGSFYPLALTGAGVSYIWVDLYSDGGVSPNTVSPVAWSGVMGDQLRIVTAPVPFTAVFGGGNPTGVTFLGYPTVDVVFPKEGAPAAGFSRLDPLPFKSTPIVDAGFVSSPVGVVSDLTAVNADDFSGRTMIIATIDEQLSVCERLGPDFRQLIFLDGGYGHGIYTGGFDGGNFWGLGAIIPAMGASGFSMLEYAPGQGYRYGPQQHFVPGRLRSFKQRVAIEGVGPVPSVTLMHAAYTAFPGTIEEFPFLLMLLEPCTACPADHDLADFRPFGLDLPTVEARCTSRDGGPPVTRFLQSPVGATGCVAETIPFGANGPLRDGVMPSTALVGRGGWAGAHGQLWYGDSLTDAIPLFIDGPPRALATSSFTADLAAIDNRTFYFLGDAGFQALQGVSKEFAPVASIMGRDDWVVVANGSVGRQAPPSAGQIVAQIRTQDPSLIHEPYFGAEARAHDGGRVLVTSASDALFSADVTGFSMQEPVPLDFRIVPLTRVPIRSLAVLDTPDGGPYTRGYVLARAELLEFVADTPEHWEARKLAVPPGAAVELWSDHDRARLGFTDGRVYSLPALKLLSGPQPDAGSFHDFYGFESESWALTAAALWRLRAKSDGGFPGEWEPREDLGVGTLAGARLYEAKGALWLFTATGAVVRLTPN